MSLPRHLRPRRDGLNALLASTAMAVLTLWAAGHWIAGRWELDARSIWPFSIAMWAVRFHEVAPFAEECERAMRGAFAASLALGCGGVLWSRGKRASNVYETGELATRADLREFGILGEGPGICVGYEQTSVRRWWWKGPLVSGIPVVYSGNEPILFSIPSGGGKTQTLYQTFVKGGFRTQVIFDPKMELCEQTRKGLEAEGYTIISVAPTLGEEHGVPWNVISEIPLGDGDVKSALQIGDEICETSTAQGTAQHFQGTAQGLFVCFALHSLYAGEGSMPQVRDMCAGICAGMGEPEDDVDRMTFMFEHLAGATHQKRWGLVGEWRDENGEELLTHPTVRMLAKGFANLPARERGSVISTLANRMTAWLDPKVRACTAGHDGFKFSELRERHERGEKTAVFLRIPTDDMGWMSCYARCFIACFWQRFGPRAGYQDIGSSKEGRVLLALEEFYQLGRVSIVPMMMSVARGVGVVILVVCQSLSQLRERYPTGSGDLISAGCPVQVVGATEDLPHAETISKKVGETGAMVRSSSWSRKGGVSTSESEVRVPILSVPEVRRLDKRYFIAFFQNMKPVVVRKRLAYQDRKARKLLPPLKKSTPTPPQAEEKKHAPATGVVVEAVEVDTEETTPSVEQPCTEAAVEEAVAELFDGPAEDAAEVKPSVEQENSETEGEKPEASLEVADTENDEDEVGREGQDVQDLSENAGDDEDEPDEMDLIEEYEDELDDELLEGLLV